MAEAERRSFKRLAVIGAGNMGSGIAQKMATEGFEVVLVDLDDDKVERGLGVIKRTLEEGVERKLFRPVDAAAILARVSGTSDWSRLTDVDLVVEAVFEDLEVKRQVFARLEEHARPTAILGTNTSSFLVTDLAASTRHPERVVGLHYFYHPAKNRLVEVVPGAQTDAEVVRAAWSLQEQIGKTPIASADASGFIVNRYFVPWLNEAVRLVEEGLADIATVEHVARERFGAGMGPFELMNVTGIPIALHAATTLGGAFGPFYAPADSLRRQVDRGAPWPLTGDARPEAAAAVAERLLAATFYVAAQLVDERVGSAEDTDIGARVGLRWPRGPFELMNRVGIAESLRLVESLCRRWELQVPRGLADQARSGSPFEFRQIRSETVDGIATLTLNRPDAMNALNEAVIDQLRAAFDAAVADPAVRGIVIAGAGKAFIAGADIRFFVKNIEAKTIDRIVEFTRAGHELLDAIDRSPKPVVARMHGLALGGGLELALACDRIIASTKASMAFPETGIGIYPGLGGTQRTPRRVGPGLAKWLIFTGQMLGAEEAAAIGLVDRAVAPEQLDEAVRAAIAEGPAGERRPPSPTSHAQIARLFAGHAAETLRDGRVEVGDDARLKKSVERVAGKAPIALRVADELITASGERSLGEGLALELSRLDEIFGTHDAYEGLSTLGKRKPNFDGR